MVRTAWQVRGMSAFRVLSGTPWNRLRLSDEPRTGGPGGERDRQHPTLSRLSGLRIAAVHSLLGRLRLGVEARGGRHVLISLSHTQNYAAAVAILENAG